MPRLERCLGEGKFLLATEASYFVKKSCLIRTYEGHHQIPKIFNWDLLFLVSQLQLLAFIRFDLAL